ncbi:hypothetical protein [Vibrio nigripulchritudo]|uniref:hypothetical protein n=1 Tax=Vibrio nigripulchritudo TaxID=28173 RepID=UPI0003B23A8A|nr:hypothetical protein [Vibrio nigripulchritudo]CCO40104.1 hypothetical protein VIBNISFn135_230001 [Vibrio nigripulchritudo SFn135]
MSLIIENNDILINPIQLNSDTSHENNSCELFSLSKAESLIVDVSNINSLLISGALDSDDLVTSLHEQMQDKLDTLKCLVVYLETRHKDSV